MGTTRSPMSAIATLVLSFWVLACADPSAAAVAESGSGPPRNLPFGDINVAVLTDVHSWVAGHGAHEPTYNADYGDVLSFYEHLEQQLRHGQSLFFVMNGDFIDGTGLSTHPPEALAPILEHMPWQAINIGNHELYRNDTIDYITKKPGGFADWWGGRYLTSNVVLQSTGNPIGSRYAFLHGQDDITKVLVFGFLYDMPDASPAVVVEDVEDVVQAQWFRNVLEGEAFDAILVLAHMDHKDPLADVILSAIRNHVQVPVQFITGHSHIRANRTMDGCSASFEAGRYLDTVGFVSFSKDSTCQFEHVFIDANTEALQDAAGVQGLKTDNGHALSTLIRETQESMGLLEVVGCSPRRFSRTWNTSEDDSFWRLYLEEIIPSSELFRRDKDDSPEKVLIQGVGAFRYDLFQGPVTVNDALCVSPYNDTFVLLERGVRGSIIQSVYAALTSKILNLTVWFPPYALGPGNIDADELYDLYTVKFDLAAVSDALQEEQSHEVEPEEMLGHATTALIIQYISRAWPSCSAKHGGRTHPNLPSFPTIAISSKPNRDLGLLIAAVVIYVGVVVAFLSYRRNRRLLRGDSCESDSGPVTVAVFA